MVLIVYVCACVYLQRAWHPSLGSSSLPAAAAGRRGEGRPVNSARRRPHPHQQPETGARELPLPEGGVLPGCAGVPHGSGCAHHTQQRCTGRYSDLFIGNIYMLSPARNVFSTWHESTHTCISVWRRTQTRHFHIHLIPEWHNGSALLHFASSLITPSPCRHTSIRPKCHRQWKLFFVFLVGGGLILLHNQD